MTDDCLFDFLCPKKKPEIVEYAPAQVYKARKKCISVITSEGR